jgi:asparagine synthase (glutamine-hydrolysing)
MRFLSRVNKGIRWRISNARERLRRFAFPKRIRDAWGQIRAENISYTTDPQLYQLLAQVRKTSNTNALIIEAGCARGGSAILMCAAKATERPMHVYDMFDMIPPPSEKDGADMKARYQEIASGSATGIGGSQYYLYEDDLKAVVESNFVRYGYPTTSNSVTLIKGDISETLVVSEPIALAHIDVDWYKPVSTALERIVPHLILGGAVVLHAYFDWSGCRKATDEYFDRIGRDGFEFDSSAGHLMVTRSASYNPRARIVAVDTD